MKKTPEKKIKSKEHNNQKKNTFYFFLVAYILAIITLITIFRPFIYPLILGGILGVFFYPINKQLKNSGLGRNTSALILVIALFFIIIFTSYFFVNSVAVEITKTYHATVQYDFEEIDSFIETTTGLNVSTEPIAISLVGNMRDTIKKSAINIIGSITSIVIGFFIMLFLLFYLFKDGENILENILNIIPVSEDHKTKIKEESRKVLYGVMYGQILMALLQGLIGGLAFFIFGLKNPVFWGIIMAILAFIPLLGTPVVWLPAGIIQLYQGNITAGIGVLAVGVFIIFVIENIIRPKFMGKRAGMHTLLMLLGIFGGLMIFGILGLLLGPIIVALCVLIIKIFTQEVLLEHD